MRVLYATDGGQVAQAAAHLLERIGRRDRVELTVLSMSDLKGIDDGAELEDTVGPIERSRARGQGRPVGDEGVDRIGLRARG